jgi:deazaflavin-dependent oxidoreductase (nitroreductase family)
MPLPYVDPTRQKSVLVRRVSKVFGTPLAQSFIKNVAAKTDPWLGRISNGRLSWSMGIVPSATLTTTGAKSNRPRQVQITYFHDGPDPIAIASNYGGGKDPLWSRNLLAHRECELGGEAFLAAEVTDSQEYARLYALAEQVYGGYADYKAKTALVGRHIPMFRLTPR